MLRPYNLFTLLPSFYLLHIGKKLVNSGNKNITLREFMDTLWVTDRFKENTFYPLLSAGWGGTIHEFKGFAAWNVLKWSFERPGGITPVVWNEVIDGVSSYISTLVNNLTRTTTITSADIVDISYHDAKYTIILADGSHHQVDHLILAVNACDVEPLLKNIPHADTTSTLLSTITCFPTTIAIHGDERFMPKNKADWSIANIGFDGIRSGITVHKSWKGSVPLFRTWLTYNPDPTETQPIQPEPLYALHN